jgi:amidohydrolase
MVRAAVQKYRPEAETLCKYMHDHPELANEEHDSAQHIVETLKNHGFEMEFPYAGRSTAFRGTFKNGSGPKIGIMVEYDALPDVGHGCGHNLHGSLCVLAGLALKELASVYNGTIYVIGTPAEEVDGAKIDMSEKGCFDGLDLCMMMHSCGGGVCQAELDALSLRNYTVTFHGKSAHAVGGPWDGHSALAAARGFLALIDLQRECFTPDVKCNAVILDGGKTANLLPEKVTLLVEFRTSAINRMERVDDIVRRCAEGACKALECTVDFKKSYDDFADMVRVKALEDEVERVYDELALSHIPVTPPIGSSDAGNTSYRCPTIQPLIAITAENYALHTREMAAATIKPAAFDAMSKGAATLAMLGLRVLTDASFRDAVHHSWKESIKVKSGR